MRLVYGALLDDELDELLDDDELDELLDDDELDELLDDDEGACVTTSV